jgi:hypothetical protein
MRPTLLRLQLLWSFKLSSSAASIDPAANLAFDNTLLPQGFTSNRPPGISTWTTINVKLPAHRAGLPGKETSFLIVPLDPAYKAGLAGHLPVNQLPFHWISQGKNMKGSLVHLLREERKTDFRFPPFPLASNSESLSIPLLCGLL